jgi:hypothetical protein
MSSLIFLLQVLFAIYRVYDVPIKPVVISKEIWMSLE